LDISTAKCGASYPRFVLWQRSANAAPMVYTHHELTIAAVRNRNAGERQLITASV
jgi:hypothetical protein